MNKKRAAFAVIFLLILLCFLSAQSRKGILLNKDHELTVGLKMGSDLLRHFIVTVDRTGGRNDLFIII